MEFILSPFRQSMPARQWLRDNELERAKENLKGRIMLSMEMTSNRMSRLGKSLITDSELLDLDRILAEIEAVDASSVAELSALLDAQGIPHGEPAERYGATGNGTSVYVHDPDGRTVELKVTSGDAGAPA